MKTSEAIAYVLEKDKDAKKYRIAKTLGVSHTTINNWLGGNRMGEDTYKIFSSIYPSVIIDDIRPSIKYKLGTIDE